ncbi:hypothetical protein C495_09849 [Natronorubrum sulfidifaciens JCM 14089]|uniref:Uncharacterized protein n=1 Tax=Natronorubrum sulfidifaciens JCM 14089 TaxID=1230460 RepID=L9W5X9_9EURY|nr:hypothetical protein C495_09849 [Natronorubrum sulfidifaciens JCM 14089]
MGTTGAVSEEVVDGSVEETKQEAGCRTLPRLRWVEEVALERRLDAGVNLDQIEFRVPERGFIPKRSRIARLDIGIVFIDEEIPEYIC